MTEPVPTVTTWCGKRLTDMTREELIEALEHTGRMVDSMRENADRERRFWADLFKYRRRIS